MRCEPGDPRPWPEELRVHRVRRDPCNVLGRELHGLGIDGHGGLARPARRGPEDLDRAEDEVLVAVDLDQLEDLEQHPLVRRLEAVPRLWLGKAESRVKPSQPTGPHRTKLGQQRFVGVIRDRSGVLVQLVVVREADGALLVCPGQRLDRDARLDEPFREPNPVSIAGRVALWTGPDEAEARRARPRGQRSTGPGPRARRRSGRARQRGHPRSG